MNELTRAMAALLRRSMALLPADRRDWAEAALAETAEVPAGWRRLNWLAGGLWLALRQAATARKLGYPLAFAAAAAGTAWSAWSGPAGDSAIVPDRVEAITITVILAGLPWTIGRARAAGGPLAYLLGPLGFPLRFAGPWPAHLYDAALTLGALLALCAPVAAGLAAARRAGRSRAGQGAMAGLCAGATAALIVAVMSTATIALLPHDTGLRQWAAGHIGRWTPLVGHWGPVLAPGTRVGYVAGNSAFAGGYLIVLLLAPLLGCALGACGARASRTGSGNGNGGGAPPEEALAGGRTL